MASRKPRSRLLIRLGTREGAVDMPDSAMAEIDEVAGGAGGGGAVVVVITEWSRASASSSLAMTSGNLPCGERKP